MNITEMQKVPSKTKGRLKFAPIKTLVIDNTETYYRAMFSSFGNGISHVLIGAVVMATIMYSVTQGPAHAVLCTVGYHFFTAEGIMSLEIVNGWSSILESKHRKQAHITLHVLGTIFSTIGIGTIVYERGVLSTPHSISGFVTFIVTLLCILMGPLHVQYVDVMKIIHTAFGVTTMIMASVTLILGLFVPEFRMWAGKEVVYILTAFIIIYTTCLVVSTILLIALQYKLLDT